MSEQQQFLANLSYQEEQAEKVDINILKLKKLGLSDKSINEGYGNYAVRQTPTFRTSPQNNKSLSDILSVAPAIINPELREDPAYKQIYSDYLDFRIEQSISGSGILLSAISNVGKAIKGGGIIQRKGTPFETRYNDLDYDSKKALDWLEALNSNKETGGEQNIQTLNNLLQLSGIVTDAAMIQTGLGGSAATVAKAIRVGNAAKADSIIGQAVAQAFINKGPSALKDLTKGFVSTGRISAGLAEGMATGLAFSFRDIMVNEDLKDMETKDQVGKLVKEFGVGFGMDAAFSVAGAVIAPLIKNHGRIFLTPNAGNLSKATIKDPDDAVKAAINALSGNVDSNTVKGLRREGLGEVADILEEIQGEAIKIKTFKDMGLNEDASMSILAIGANMRMDKIGDKYEVVLDSLAKKKKIKTVSTLAEVGDLIETKNLKGLKKQDTVELARAASINKELKIQEVWETVIKSPNAKIDLADFAESIIPRSGAFNAKTKSGGLKFVKAAIKELGEGIQDNLGKLDVNLSSNFFKNIPNTKSDILLLPRQINNVNELRQYTKYIGNFITEHGNNINKTDLDSVLTKLGDATGKWSINDMDWVAKQAKKANLAIKKIDETYYVSDGLETIAFANEELLGNYVHSKSITPESFKKFLKVEKDYSLIVDPDLGGFTVLNQAKAKIAHGETIVDITANNTMLRPKYPIETAPRLGFVNDSIRSVEVLGDYVEGSIAQLNKYWDNYSNTKMMSDIFDSSPTQFLKKGSGTKVLLTNNKRKWIVSADNFGMRQQTFKSEKGLRKFLDLVGTPEKTLQTVGGQKGVAVLANKAGFIVYKAGESPQVFKNFADTTDYVKRLPNKALTPEALEEQEYLIRMNSELYSRVFKDVNLDNFATDSRVAGLKKIWDKAHTEKLESATKRRLPQNLRNIFNKIVPNRAQVYSMAKGHPERLDLPKAFDDLLEVEKRMKVIHFKTTSAMNTLNKLVKEDRRKELGQLLSKEMPEADWEKNFFKITGGKLNDKDIKYLRGTRSLFDQAGKLNGFGDTLDSIENYFPKMKTLSLEDIWGTSKKTNTISLVEKAYGRKLYPAEAKFFQNMRKVDLSGYIFEQDPAKLLDRYISDTLKTTYLEPAIEKLASTGERLLEEGPELGAIRKMTRQARGLAEDSITEDLKEFVDSMALKSYQKTANGYALAHKAGKSTNPNWFRDKQAFMKGKVTELSKESIANMTPQEQQMFATAVSKHQFRQNPINKVMGVVTLSVQSGKGWLPVRNTFQPETHLAPIFGIDAIVKAKEDVSKMSREAYMFLAEKGIFQPKSIQAQLGTAGSGIVEKGNEIGLAWFKGSDDFDRAVGFMTVRNAMAEGLEGSTHWGDKSGSFFSQQSRLYAAPKHIRDNVLNTLAAGNLDDAVTIYAQWMNDMTFLNYSKINRPEAFGSFFGKIFGQMGTFATQTLASRKYFMENLTKADKAFYVGRAVLAGFALNSAFSELTGTEVNNFSTLNSMLFMGGPVVETLVAGRDAFSPSDYKRARGRSALGRQATTLFSPINTIGNIFGGVQKIIEGDPFFGAQQLLNFPGRGDPEEKDLTYADYLSRI